MTLERAPLTPENGLFRLLGIIGVPRAAELLGHSEDYVYALSHPDRRERLTVDDAIALELEHARLGGDDFPIFHAYGLKLKAACAAQFADAQAIAQKLPEVLREAGEAHAAIAAASAPGATAVDLKKALREGEEAIASLTAAIALVHTRLESANAQPP